jgi:hypothetical protein
MRVCSGRPQAFPLFGRFQKQTIETISQPHVSSKLFERLATLMCLDATTLTEWNPAYRDRNN